MEERFLLAGFANSKSLENPVGGAPALDQVCWAQCCRNAALARRFPASSGRKSSQFLLLLVFPCRLYDFILGTSSKAPISKVSPFALPALLEPTQCDLVEKARVHLFYSRG